MPTSADGQLEAVLTTINGRTQQENRQLIEENLQENKPQENLPILTDILAQAIGFLASILKHQRSMFYEHADRAVSAIQDLCTQFENFDDLVRCLPEASGIFHVTSKNYIDGPGSPRRMLTLGMYAIELDPVHPPFEFTLDDAAIYQNARLSDELRPEEVKAIARLQSLDYNTQLVLWTKGFSVHRGATLFVEDFTTIPEIPSGLKNKFYVCTKVPLLMVGKCSKTNHDLLLLREKLNTGALSLHTHAGQCVHDFSCCQGKDYALPLDQRVEYLILPYDERQKRQAGLFSRMMQETMNKK